MIGVCSCWVLLLLIMFCWFGGLGWLMILLCCFCLIFLWKSLLIGCSNFICCVVFFVRWW